MFSSIKNRFTQESIWNSTCGYLLMLILVITGSASTLHAQCIPGETTTVTFSSGGSGTFQVPVGVTSVRVQVWGAGGRGGSRQSRDGAGGGGGGGAYSESTLTLNSGRTYFYNVGAGSSNENPGGDSWFSKTNGSGGALVLAKGGESAETDGKDEGDGADGGEAAAGIGSIRYSGGDGADADDDDEGGGGGSSASPTRDGRNGDDEDGGNADGQGGDGGDGSERDNGTGEDGQNPGGGGGGATRDRNSAYAGGKGGEGLVILTYTCPVCGPPINYSADVQQFIVPEGVTSISVEGWGGGGKGGLRSGNDGGTGGGGAGAYSRSTLTVSPGETLYFVTGAGSTSNGNDGGDSWISRNSNGNSPILLAKGGQSVSGTNNRSGASGGRASQGEGDFKDNGGDGETVNNGNNADGGDGGDSPNGGDGGDGGDGSNNDAIDGEDGEEPGGGGGGAKTGRNWETRQGGNGGNGLIRITYACESFYPPNACYRYVDDGSISGTIIMEFLNDCSWEAPEGLLEFEVLVVGGGGGGGVRSGGGGGGGGLVHGRAVVEEIFPQGLPANTSFSIVIGEGGDGSSNVRNRGQAGQTSSFDLGGSYEIIAGGGGGGGSDDSDVRSGGSGLPSSQASTTGFSVVNGRMLTGSDGGAGHNGNNPSGSNGGDGDRHSGGGGGGAGSSGEDAPDDDRGGDGGAGLIIFDFDPRIFSAGGGGGGEDDDEEDRGFGGTNLRGGNGGFDDDDDALAGEDGQSPGSGGGGGGHSEDVRAGGGSRGTVLVRYEIARILPVEYLYFEADFNPSFRYSELTWATANEWENDRYEIERSINNTNEWEKIDQISGAGYSDSKIDYEYIDRKPPVSGGNIFYRLKQVDFSGTSSYSETRAVKVDPLPGIKQWRAYPNPTNGSTFDLAMLDRSTYRDEPITIRAISPSGQFEVIPVDDMRNIGTQMTEYFAGQASGIYTIEVAWGFQKEYHKVILTR